MEVAERNTWEGLEFCLKLFLVAEYFLSRHSFGDQSFHTIHCRVQCCWSKEAIVSISERLQAPVCDVLAGFIALG